MKTPFARASEAARNSGPATNGPRTSTKYTFSLAKAPARVNKLPIQVVSLLRHTVRERMTQSARMIEPYSWITSSETLRKGFEIIRRGPAC
jgi:hypothetical protein